MACLCLGSPPWPWIATGWTPLVFTEVALKNVCTLLTASYCHLSSHHFQTIKCLICAFKQGHKLSTGSPGNLQYPLLEIEGIRYDFLSKGFPNKILSMV